MKNVCNSCGREFDESVKMYSHTAENGTSYLLCEECETNGVEVAANNVYYICKNCGFPNEEKEFHGKCGFCGLSGTSEKTELTEVEEQLLDENPDKLYREKFGDETAKKIAEWIESPERKKAGIRHKRDRHADTAFVFGIIAAYFLLDLDIRVYIHNKLMFMSLLIPSALVLISAPVFKALDRQPRKRPLPIWGIYAAMAVFIGIYFLIIRLFG